MEKFRLYIYLITIVVSVAIVWTSFLLNVKIGDQVIPTLVNGITSSMSVIVGLSGAFIGIMLRETNNKDSKAKEFYFGVIVVLMIPLTMLWSTYSWLAMGFSELAVRYGLSGLILSLYVFFTVVIYAVRTKTHQEEISNQT